MLSNPTREDFARMVLDLRAELAEVTEARRRSVLHGPPPRRPEVMGGVPVGTGVRRRR